MAAARQCDACGNFATAPGDADFATRYPAPLPDGWCALMIRTSKDVPDATMTAAWEVCSPECAQNVVTDWAVAEINRRATERREAMNHG